MENDKVISSVASTNDEAISNIMKLYNIEKFDLDCTYSKGVFWKNLTEPIYKTDLYPQADGVIEADSIDLPFDDNSMKSIMYDPPFVITGRSYKSNNKGSSIISKRFEGFFSFKELKESYYGTIKEAYRLLQDDGILVIKCQDTVSGGKNHFTHNIVMNMGLDVGFYPRDLFILKANVRLNSFGGRWKKQHHARKYHSYFWVFQKTKCKVDYSF